MMRALPLNVDVAPVLGSDHTPFGRVIAVPTTRAGSRTEIRLHAACRGVVG